MVTIKQVSHDTWRLELERFEIDDVIFPFFTVDVNMEHVLAWKIHRLQSLSNKRCRKINAHRVPWAKQATQKDDGLVYYYQMDASSAALVRNGRIQQLTLRGCLLGTGECDDAVDFARYIVEKL